MFTELILFNCTCIYAFELQSSQAPVKVPLQKIKMLLNLLNSIWKNNKMLDKASHLIFYSSTLLIQDHSMYYIMMIPYRLLVISKIDTPYYLCYPSVMDN